MPSIGLHAGPTFTSGMLPTSFFSPVLGSTLIMRLPSRSGNPNMHYPAPRPYPTGRQGLGDNDPFKRFRRGHRLCLCGAAPQEAGRLKQQRHRACHDSGMVHPVPPDVSLCIGTRAMPRVAPVLSKAALRGSRSAKAGQRPPRNGFAFRLALALSSWESRPIRWTREEGFGRGAGSCWNGRPHLQRRNSRRILPMTDERPLFQFHKRVAQLLIGIHGVGASPYQAGSRRACRKR